MNTSHVTRPVALQRTLRRTLSSVTVLLALLLCAGGAIAQGIFDFGTSIPVAGPNDISQTNSTTVTAVPGINYYVDGNSPGQTFTTGTNSGGYVFTGLFLKEVATSAGGGMPQLSAYTVRVFSLTNIAAGTATLLSTYITTNSMTFTQGDWIQCSGFTNVLAANTVYGYSINRNGAGYWMPAVYSTSDLYTNGRAIRFPTATGAVSPATGLGTNYDAAFVAKLVPNTDPLVFDTVIAPASPVYAGTLVTLSASFSGTAPITTFVWQGGDGVTWTNLPGSTTNTYALNTTGMTATTNQYRLIVTGAAGTTTNVPGTLNLLNASAPVLAVNTVLTPATAFVGGSALMTATFAGTLPIYYQWQYTNNNGGPLVDISGATNSPYTRTNIQFSDAGYYRLTASNSVGVTSSSFAALAVRSPVVMSDFGTTDPATNAYDIAQFSTSGNAGNPGVGYYTDNSTPGQTFTTGPDAGGYSLASLYIKYRTLADGAHVLGNPWTMRLYSLTNAHLGNAVLIGTYTNENVAPAINTARWLKWFGNITNVLAPNSAYAYTVRARNEAGTAGAGFLQVGNASSIPSFYPGGRLVSIAAAGGAITAFSGTVTNFDATFMVNLVPAGYAAVQDVSMNPTNGSAIFAGAAVTLNVSAIGTSIGYIWQTDSGTGGASFTDLPTSNTNIYALNTSAFTPNTYQLRVLVTNSFNTATSSVLTLSVQAAVIQTVSIAPANTVANPVYAGTPVTLSSTVLGNSLTYFWQGNDGAGGGLTNIPNSNTNILIFDTSAMTPVPGTYLYQLMVSNGSGTVTSSQLTLNLTNASGPVLLTGTTLTPNVVFVGGSSVMTATFSGSLPFTGFQWYFATNGVTNAIAGAVTNSFTLTNAQFANAGTYFITVSNNPPGIGPTASSSTPRTLFVAAPPVTNTISAAVYNSGSGTPYVGTNDISQLAEDGSGVQPAGLNYYTDGRPGQIFKTGSTPPSPAGYPLNQLYVKQDSLGTVSGDFATPTTYTLRIYQVFDGTNVALITSYLSTNSMAFTSGNWIRWEGLTNVLRTNSTYAFALTRTSGYWKMQTYSANAYADGEAVLLPVTSGAATFSTVPNAYDATFIVGLTPLAAPVETVATAITPASVYAGQTASMIATFAGSLPIRYQWQHASTNLPGATNATYTIPVVNAGHGGTYTLLASNLFSAGTNVTSTPATLTVLATPATFVANYAYTDTTPYSGPGVIGSGTYWNRLNGTSVNVTDFADDGTTPLGISVNITKTGTFANTASPIELLKRYLLLQGASTETFAFSNLIPGIYNLVFYSCNGNYQSSRTSFVLNGVTNTAVTTTDASFIQNNNYVVFNNITVSNGSINGQWFRPTAEGAINGAQLQLAVAFDNPQILIATQPVSRTNLTGTPASFSVVAQALGQIFYQWRSNSVAVSGATNSFYSAYTGVPGVWSYDVIVATNLSLGSSVTSSVATLTVVDPNPIVWRGYTANWDLVSGNWSNLLTAADNVVFTPGDVVRFDDTATSFSPLVTGALTPSSVTVTNDEQNYVLSGSGSLTGAMNLIKANNGTITISNKNTYTGGSTVNGGIVVLASGGAQGSVSGNLTINAAGTVNLTATDALGYSGNFVTNVNLVGGIMDNATANNEAYATMFNLTAGTMSSSGGGAYNMDGASGVVVSSLASSTASTISGRITLRSSGVVFSTALGTVPGGVDLNLSGIIGGGAQDITKTGAGTLALSASNTFSGLTTVANGRLLINGSIPGAVTVNSGAVLGGNGFIGGIVTIGGGATLGAGASIGSLTLSNSPSLGGTVVVEIDRNGGSPLADLVTVVGNPITYGGTLVVSNVGAALVAGDTFTTFVATGHSGSFSSIVGNPGAGKAFNFSAGVLSVVATVATNPTNLTSSVSGGSLNLSWPSDHLGWFLQTQTNSRSVGLTMPTNTWFDVSGSSAVTNTSITIDALNPTVFFRLRSP